LRKITLGILLLGLLVASPGCQSGDDDVAESSAPTTAAHATAPATPSPTRRGEITPTADIDSVACTQDDLGAIVAGGITNTSNTTLNYDITAALRQQDGHWYASVAVPVERLSAGAHATWSGRPVVPFAVRGSCDVIGVTAQLAPDRLATGALSQ
jgi:hypothetical protein